MKRFRFGPLFTPPSLRGTIQRPSQTGAANWGGAAFDPETGVLFVKVSDTYHTSRICKNDGQDPLVGFTYSNYCGQFGLFAWRGPGTGRSPAACRPLAPRIEFPTRSATAERNSAVFLSQSRPMRTWSLST